MAFSETYAALERKFREQVEVDNSGLGIESSYVHNFIPPGPVDYVLIAMEPSTGVPGSPTEALGRDCIDPSQMERNFSWSVEDFILHYCIREYLCQEGETYHLTDLAKGGMTIRFAGKQRKSRYESWYSLLEEELRLMNKPGKTRLIAIGSVVADFLKRKLLCRRVEKVLHYSRNAAPHRDRAIQRWRERFKEFSESLDLDAFGVSIAKVLNDADMNSYIPYRPEGGKEYNLTESRRKLMFHYKNRFIELKDASDIVLSIREGGRRYG